MSKKDVKFYPENKRSGFIHLAQLKDKYIQEGYSLKELSLKYNIPEISIRDACREEGWDELRQKYISEGLATIQNIQLSRAQSLFDIENKFKSLKLMQLQKMLEYFVIYQAEHGHLFKIHAVTKEILLDNDGLPIPIKLPNISKEISDLKESVTVSEGMMKLIDRIESVLAITDKNLEKKAIETDIVEFDELFERKTDE